VLRVYHVREEPRVKGPGRWEGAELRVRLSAGKETVAGPLRWVPLTNALRAYPSRALTR
jgi:hypothetical protein